MVQWLADGHTPMDGHGMPWHWHDDEHISSLLLSDQSVRCWSVGQADLKYYRNVLLCYCGSYQQLLVRTTIIID